MGHFESFTALALGRTPYEPSVIQPSPPSSPVNPITPGANATPYVQQYTGRGRPINPQTREQERRSIRAANEVLQVTGVVEYSSAVKARDRKAKAAKTRETFIGLRFVELGGAVLIGGLWGVLGLRRRVLLYKSYADWGIVELIKHDMQTQSLLSLLYAGLPPVVAYQAIGWVVTASGLTFQLFWEQHFGRTKAHKWWEKSVVSLSKLGLCWVSLILRTFAMLQQLGMIPGARLLPSLGSFIPFGKSSPLQLPPRALWNLRSIGFCASAILESMQPLLAVYLYDKFKRTTKRSLYRPIYALLPRPTGGSMFTKTNSESQVQATDAARAARTEIPNNSQDQPTEDQPTLRALEGLPALEQSTLPADQASSDDGSDDGQTRRRRPVEAMLSFEFEAADADVHNGAPYAATLRSSAQPKSSTGTVYKVTGMTVMPSILACQGITEFVSSILAIPFEAAMVRVLGSAYRRSAGLGVEDLWAPVGFGGYRFSFTSLKNLLVVLALQFVITGALWTGYTAVVDWVRRFVTVEKKESDGTAKE